MKFIPRTNKQVFLFLSAFGLLNAGAMYSLIPQPDNLSNTQEQTDGWQLPQVNTENAKTQYEQLRKIQPWGKEEPEQPSEEELAALNAQNQVATNHVSWQFMGVVQEGGKKFILVKNENNKIERYGFGKSLPDGTTILAIYDYRVKILKNNKKSIIELFDVEE